MIYLLSVAFQFSADYDKTGRVTLVVCFGFAISRFPIQCGLRRQALGRL